MTGYNEPLGLARGSVRAIITILVVILSPVVFYFAPSARDAWIGLVVLALRDYSTVRAEQNREDGPALPPPES